MKKIEKKFLVKLPDKIQTLYCTKKNIIIFKSLTKQSSLKLDLKILISKTKKTLYITPIVTNKKLQNCNLKTLKGTTLSLIKQKIFESLTTVYVKMNFVGLGYRVFNVENYEDGLLMFKLGFSHLIYFKTPNILNVYNLKLTKLFIYGNSYSNVTQTASLIRQIKPPEPYKGKGVLYEGEKIVLKDGKKV